MLRVPSIDLIMLGANKNANVSKLGSIIRAVVAAQIGFVTAGDFTQKTAIIGFRGKLMNR